MDWDPVHVYKGGVWQRHCAWLLWKAREIPQIAGVWLRKSTEKADTDTNLFTQARQQRIELVKTDPCSGKSVSRLLHHMRKGIVAQLRHQMTLKDNKREASPY